MSKGVSNGESSCYLSAQFYNQLGRWWLSHYRPQCSSLNKFHDDETAGFGFHNLVDGNNVGVIERRDGPGFAD